MGLCELRTHICVISWQRLTCKVDQAAMCCDYVSDVSWSFDCRACLLILFRVWPHFSVHVWMDMKRLLICFWRMEQKKTFWQRYTFVCTSSRRILVCARKNIYSRPFLTPIQRIPKLHYIWQLKGATRMLSCSWSSMRWMSISKTRWFRNHLLFAPLFNTVYFCSASLSTCTFQ